MQSRLPLALAARLVVALSVLVAASPVARAQVNVESIAGGVSDGLGGSVGADFSLQKGNVDYSELGAFGGVSYIRTYEPRPDEDPEVTLAWLRYRVLLDGQVGFQTSDGERIANEGFGHLRWTDMPRRRVGYEVYQQEQFNEFQRLELRSLLGTGVRVVLVNIPVFQAWFGSGYMVEWERWTPEGGVPETTRVTNHRWSSYATVHVHVPDSVLSFANTIYVQPRLDAFSDVQLLDEATVDVQINETFTFRTALRLHYDSEPLAGVKPLDVETSTGVVLSF